MSRPDEHPAPWEGQDLSPALEFSPPMENAGPLPDVSSPEREAAPLPEEHPVLYGGEPAGRREQRKRRLHVPKLMYMAAALAATVTIAATTPSSLGASPGSSSPGSSSPDLLPSQSDSGEPSESTRPDTPWRPGDPAEEPDRDPEGRFDPVGMWVSEDGQWNTYFDERGVGVQLDGSGYYVFFLWEKEQYFYDSKTTLGGIPIDNDPLVAFFATYINGRVKLREMVSGDGTPYPVYSWANSWDTVSFAPERNGTLIGYSIPDLQGNPDEYGHRFTRVPGDYDSFLDDLTADFGLDEDFWQNFLRGRDFRDIVLAGSTWRLSPDTPHSSFTIPDEFLFTEIVFDGNGGGYLTAVVRPTNGEPLVESTVKFETVKNQERNSPVIYFTLKEPLVLRYELWGNTEEVRLNMGENPFFEVLAKDGRLYLQAPSYNDMIDFGADFLLLERVE